MKKVRSRVLICTARELGQHFDRATQMLEPGNGQLHIMKTSHGGAGINRDIYGIAHLYLLTFFSMKF